MLNSKSLTLVAVLIFLTASLGLCADDSKAVKDQAKAFEMNKLLGRGVNI